MSEIQHSNQVTWWQLVMSKWRWTGHFIFIRPVFNYFVVWTHAIGHILYQKLYFVVEYPRKVVQWHNVRFSWTFCSDKRRTRYMSDHTVYRTCLSLIPSISSRPFDRDWRSSWIMSHDAIKVMKFSIWTIVNSPYGRSSID